VGAGGSFGAAVALFPVLERAWADADECGESGLAENLKIFTTDCTDFTDGKKNL
jgi:hypothetical protein